jgi:hypothetical protein
MFHIAMALLRIRALPPPIGVLMVVFLVGYGFYWLFVRNRTAR